MPDLNDVAYYNARALKSHAAAEAAIDPTVAAVHSKMAKKYQELAQLAAEIPRGQA